MLTPLKRVTPSRVTSKMGAFCILKKTFFLLLTLILISSCAASKVTSSNAPRFKVSVETENGNTYSSTKDEIDISKEKDGAIKTITIEVTNCNIYKSYTAQLDKDGTSIDSDASTDNTQRKSDCILFTETSNKLAEAGTYQANFTGQLAEPTETNSAPVEGLSPAVNYSTAPTSQPIIKVTVTPISGEVQTSTSEDIKVNTPIKTINYQIVNCDLFNEVAGNILKFNGTLLETISNYACDLTTWTVIQDHNKLAGTYTLTLNLRTLSGTEMKASVPQVIYSLS